MTALPLSGQQVVQYWGGPVRAYTVTEGVRVKPMLPKHEFGIGIGFWYRGDDFVFDDQAYDWDNGSYYYGHYYPDYNPQTPGQKYENSMYYWDEVRSTHAVNGRYFYSVANWFQVGATISYYGARQNQYHTSNRSISGTIRRHYLSAMPTVRLSYVSTKYFRMYAAGSIGYGCAWVKGVDDNSYRGYEFLAYDFTYLGFSAGDAFYVSGELAYSTTGTFRLTAGYRF